MAERCQVCGRHEVLVKHHSEVGLIVACAGCHRMIHDNRIDVVKEGEEIRFIRRSEYPLMSARVKDVFIEVDWTHRRIKVRYDGKKKSKQYKRISLGEAVKEILREIGRKQYFSEVIKKYKVPPDSY